MKKLIPSILSLLLTQLIYSQPVPPVRVADCPAITEVPVMDGLNDESFWSEEQDMTRFNEIDGDWNGEADYYITFRMAWGWSFFYTIVTIVDDVEHSWNGTTGNPWEFDNIEWFFQLDTQTVPTAYTDNTIQVRFNRGEAGFQSSSFRSGITQEDFQWYSENTHDGWVLECAIPWTNVMPDGSLPEDIYDWIEPGGLIGFDLSCFDSDQDDPYVGARASGTQTAWDEDGEPGDIADGTEDNAWNNTSVFGYLNMMGEIIEDRWPDSIYFVNENYNKVADILYPNPVSSILNLSGENKFSLINIYSTSGELISKKYMTNTTIDVSHLKPGLYLAVFDNAEAFKFIKE